MDKKIGEYLRDIRVEQDLTLEDISEATKIKVRILKDIEANNFDNFGGRGYAKALILSYARYLQADIETVLSMLDTCFATIKVKYYRNGEIQPRKYMISTSVFSLILLILLIAAISYFSVRLYKEGKLHFPFRIFSPRSNTEEPVDSSQAVTPQLPAPREEITPLLPEQTLNLEALHDTINYTHKLLFKDKDSPFNLGNK
ncbi:MAG: helix-turn-helix domain-containing protein [Candidatus Cloacimonetes bacterium]|nr:helix-turn-helix domain-containing protein [Candidatus Cloacimonadota bacterium]